MRDDGFDDVEVGVKPATAGDIEDFDELLEDAMNYASTEWEEAFLTDIDSRYSRLGPETFISAKQLATLKKIANWA